MKTHVGKNFSLTLGVSSSRRKSRLAHFSAPSHIRHKILSATLNPELRKKHNIRSLPIRKDDEVEIISGSNKGTKGKIISVYRKRFCVYIEKLTKSKLNGKFSAAGLIPRCRLQDPNPPKQRPDHQAEDLRR